MLPSRFGAGSASDVGHVVLAQSQIAADEPEAWVSCDEGEDLRRGRHVRSAGDALWISPLKAATSVKADALPERLYAAVPAVLITDLLR